ncbi:hypothetical protein PM082_020131 [Marasmius tenuissimus]|nr:hypothetical protein PM082_020131 [Marasmius tenuissimus]
MGRNRPRKAKANTSPNSHRDAMQDPSYYHHCPSDRVWVCGCPGRHQLVISQANYAETLYASILVAENLYSRGEYKLAKAQYELAQEFWEWLGRPHVPRELNPEEYTTKWLICFAIVWMGRAFTMLGFLLVVWVVFHWIFIGVDK